MRYQLLCIVCAIVVGGLMAKYLTILRNRRFHRNLNKLVEAKRDQSN